MNFNFQYPVTDFSQALAVINPNTNIDVLEDNLYVNLDAVRGDKFLRQILSQLGIAGDTFIGTANAFPKILLTGHRGTGKSVELERISKEIEQIYLTVLINIEEELIKLTAVEPEDIYQLIIIKLIELLEKNKIKFNLDKFKAIAKRWYDEELFEHKEDKKSNTETGGEVSAGVDAFVFKLKSFLKTSITSESDDTRLVRNKIKNNINEIIENLNAELSLLNQELNNHNFKGVIFILDGTEKIPYETSKKIFVLDAPILNQINASFIIASPVLSQFDITSGVPYFNTQIFPMVKLNKKENIKIFKEIVTKRIEEETFFEEGVLDCIAEKSGGAIRLMLEIVYESLLTAGYNNKISKSILADVLKDKGLYYYRRLDAEHKRILRNTPKGDYDFGNPKVNEMLFSLVLLMQNGDTIINPVLKPYIEGTKNYLCD